MKLVIQSSWSYIKESGDFLRKIKQIKKLPENSILVTADAVGLYPSILHELGFKVLEQILEKRESKSQICAYYFEFNGDVKQQIAGIAIQNKFATPYAYTFMDQVESEILKSKHHQLLVWFTYIDDNFSSGLVVNRN